MSKTLKWLFAGLSLLIVGGLVFVFGMTGLKWDFYKLDTETYTAKTYAASPETEVAGVELNVKSFPITVRIGDELRFEYYETESSEVSVTQTDGIMKINESYDYNFFTRGMFQFGRINHAYVLTLPSGIDLSVSGPNGNVKLQGIESDTVRLGASNLDVDIVGCRLGTVKINSSNADIDITGGAAETIDIDVTNLDITVTNAEIGAMTVKSTNGDMEVERSKCGSIVFESTNGDADITYSECESIRLDAINADFSLYRITVNTLNITGTNLDADIFIRGDRNEYTVETHGHDLPPEQTGVGDKKIYLRGTNCDVKLRFVD